MLYLKQLNFRTFFQNAKSLRDGVRLELESSCAIRALFPVIWCLEHLLRSTPFFSLSTFNYFIHLELHFISYNQEHNEIVILISDLLKNNLMMIIFLNILSSLSCHNINKLFIFVGWLPLVFFLLASNATLKKLKLIHFKYSFIATFLKYIVTYRQCYSFLSNLCAYV